MSGSNILCVNTLRFTTTFTIQTYFIRFLTPSFSLKCYCFSNILRRFGVACFPEYSFSRGLFGFGIKVNANILLSMSHTVLSRAKKTLRIPLSLKPPDAKRTYFSLVLHLAQSFSEYILFTNY